MPVIMPLIAEIEPLLNAKRVFGKWVLCLKKTEDFACE
jgi:hypothetical protein